MDSYIGFVLKYGGNMSPCPHTGCNKKNGPPDQFFHFWPFFQHFLKLFCTQLTKNSKASCLVCKVIRFNLLGGHFRMNNKYLHLMYLWHDLFYYEGKTYQKSNFSSIYQHKFFFHYMSIGYKIIYNRGILRWFNYRWLDL